MRSEPVQLLPVCRADQEGVLLVLQQCPFLPQLLNQQGEVGRLLGWGGDSGDSGDTRVVSGLGRGDRVATEAATRRDSGCD